MTEMTEMVRRSDRRHFIAQAAGAFATVGGAMALWPFVDQMNPHAGSPPLPVTDVDLTAIGPGESRLVSWHGRPVLVRHRSPRDVALARATSVEELPDRLARNAALPARAQATDANRTKEGYERWLVVIGLCTHLGCRLAPQIPDAAGVTGEGWLCPCHAARFDLSGRIRSGPARSNLPVPPYRFLTPTMIRIG